MSTDIMSTVAEHTLTLDEEALQEAIEEGVAEAYRSHGYMKETDEGDEAPDKTALHEAIYSAVKGAIVNEPKERSALPSRSRADKWRRWRRVWMCWRLRRNRKSSLGRAQLPGF